MPLSHLLVWTRTRATEFASFSALRECAAASACRAVVSVMRTHGEGNDVDAGTADDAGLKAAREYSELDCAGVLTTEAALFVEWRAWTS